MRVFRVIVLTLIAAIPFTAQDRPITIRAGLLLDGKGGSQRNASVVVQGSKIQSVSSNAANPTYDLSKLTVLPGMIDTHVHISWHFGADGRYEPRAKSPAEETLYTVENVYLDLMSGFTTVQSVGANSD